MIQDEFTEEEKKILKKFVSNVDKPIFILKNLPEVIKGALFSRYSRSAKGIRRLLVDEFLGNIDIAARDTSQEEINIKKNYAFAK